MRGLVPFLLACGLWMSSLLAVQAQEDDKGFLTRMLQDALSDAGREVRIEGFKGALSSTASFEEMTIADGDGIWLTLRNVELIWTRSALLRGRLEVESLTADLLDIPRLPIAESTSLPEAEAGAFSLPSLPVSIDITTFEIGRIELGAPLLGEAAQMQLTASAHYSDALADVDIRAQRTDGRPGRFEIKANLERSSDVLDLLVRLNEGAGGIASRLLNLPGQPAVDMTVQGSGPLDDFGSDIRIATEGRERLAGRVTLGAQTSLGGPPDRRIRADIGGDITALLAPRYRPFFGTDLRLELDALQKAKGGFEVSAFSLLAQAITLEGRLAFDADRWPRFIDISGAIADPDGTPTLLPVSSTATTAEQVALSVQFDADDGEMLDAAFDLRGLGTSAGRVEQLRLGLTGALRRGAPGSDGQFTGTVDFEADGMALQDEALAAAIGEEVTGSARISYRADAPIDIDGLALEGADYGLAGNLSIAGLETGFSTDLDINLQSRNLGRYAALAGLPLAGQTQLGIKGRVVPLSGQLDLSLSGVADDIALYIDQVDALLAGRTTLTFKVTRNEGGVALRDLDLRNAAMDLTGKATLRSAGSELELAAHLGDIALVLPAYAGPVSATVTASQAPEGWTVEARTSGPYDAELTAIGRATGPEASVVFTADVPDMARFADQIEGPVQADGRVWRDGKSWQISAKARGPYRARAMIEGAAAPVLDVAFDLSLPDVAPLVPGVSGPLAATGVARQTPQGILIDTSATGPYASRGSAKGVMTGPQAAVDFRFALSDVASLVNRLRGPLEFAGTAKRQGSDWRIDTSADGPSGTQVTIAGVLKGNGTLDIDLFGAVPLGLARPFIAPRDLQGQARFDLAVSGPPALSSLSGSIETTGATLIAPNLRFGLQNIAADIRLARNRAQVDVTGQATGGGDLRLAGGVTLTPSLPAELQIALRDVALIDPRLYRSSLDGALRLAGPLTGGAGISGQITIGETEITVPSTGLTSIGDIPQIKHVGAASAVRRTQQKAGLADARAASGAGATGPDYGLDLTIRAPGRIFVRGRGLDAELGGDLTLTGRTNRIISSGRFELLRGRLDVLGKRFDLVEGSTDFQGDMLPHIRFVSQTTTPTGEIRVIVEGPADAPVVSFEATPAAPQDEVLAQLLFGRQISDISAFQALQLANAVATLAGREGAGVISNLRDGFGLDDLDVTTTDSGATAVSVGKYLSENVYTDITAASDGTGEISLNLDLTPNLKGKGTLGSDGDSGIGLFFEKDY